MQIDQIIKEGVDALKNKKLNEAEKIFKLLVTKYPTNSEINHFLGITFQLLNKIHEATEYYKKAVELNPNFSEANKNLGNMYYRMGIIDKAEIYYKKALKLDPKLDEAKINLETVFEQKKVSDWIFENKQKKIKKPQNINLNPFITLRKVEPELLNQLYKIHTIDLNKTGDVRFGNGKCSSNMKLFESDNQVIKSAAIDIVRIIEELINSKIYVADSFFNILGADSGTKPHKHLSPYDKSSGLEKQKYSLTYYISVGDQSGKEPGILKLYEPDEKILPKEGTMVIIPSNRTHSAIYDGKKDRVMIGVNFYSL